jgi:6-phosphogluconolactonase
MRPREGELRPSATASEAPSVRRLRDAEELARCAAFAVVQAAREAVQARGSFSLALAGGDTPRRLYQKLAAGPALDWSRAELFFGDERSVPPGHPESNYRMAREALLEPAGVDPLRVHRIQAERADLDAVAREYEAELRRILGATPEAPPPRLDLVLLGLGTDGHTASLFPYTAALLETRRCVVANDVPRLGSQRVTITFPLIGRARRVLVLVGGESKAGALAEVLEGAWDPERLPAQRLRAPEGRVSRVDWLVDAAAASRLRNAEPLAP